MIRPPLHVLWPRTDYVGTLSAAAAARLGVSPGRRVYEPESIFFAQVFDGAERVGVVELGPGGILPDSPPTVLS